MNMEVCNDEDECSVWSVSIDGYESAMRPSPLPLSRFTFNFQFYLEVATFNWHGLTWTPHPIIPMHPPTFFGTAVCVKDQRFSYYKIREELDHALARLPLPVEERPDLVMFALDKAYHLFYGQQQEIPEYTSFDFAFKLLLERDCLVFPMEEDSDDDLLHSSPCNSGVSSSESFV